MESRYHDPYFPSRTTMSASRSRQPRPRSSSRERWCSRDHDTRESTSERRSHTRRRSRSQTRSKYRDSSPDRSHKSKSRIPQSTPNDHNRNSARRSESRTYSKKKKKDSSDGLKDAHIEIQNLLKEYSEVSKEKKSKKRSREVDEPQIAPESYFRPDSGNHSLIENYRKCRICRSYFSDSEEGANKHISLHPNQTFCARIPTDTWYYDIEEVIQHFAKMNFSKEDLKEKIFNLDLVKYPESLVGYACFSCLGNSLNLDCSTDEDFRDHVQNSCKDDAAEAEVRRISFCRGCHNRFRCKSDLQHHVKAASRQRCFPARSVVDKIYTSVQFPSQIRTPKQEKIKTEPVALNAIQPVTPASTFPQKELRCPSGGKENLSSMNLSDLSNINIHEYIQQPSSSSYQPASFNVYQDLHNLSSERLQSILQAANVGPHPGDPGVHGDASAGVDEMENLYVIPPGPKINPTPLWHSPEEPQSTGGSQIQDSTRFDVSGEPQPPLVSPVQMFNNEDGDDEVMVVVNPEDCRLLKCAWNGNHISTCKRAEISERCGQGQCSKRDLHQWYGFARNKFLQGKSHRSELCPKLKLYANCKYTPISRKWDVSDEQVPKIPLHRQENFKGGSDDCVDPRLLVGASYPRNKVNFIGKTFKLEASKNDTNKRRRI